MPIDEVKELIKNKQWEELLKEDQLIKQRNEHKVNYVPTLKWYGNLTDYLFQKRSILSNFSLPLGTIEISAQSHFWFSSLSRMCK